ncbi:unnamed protein product [Clavelina lepadiformis]|uniref:Uncharacterized protein n=1 Tax=Clavelina lepadiformis TaxID=159417 RepID=A0ABP0F483_CLALP
MRVNDPGAYGQRKNWRILAELNVTLHRNKSTESYHESVRRCHVIPSTTTLSASLPRPSGPVFARSLTFARFCTEASLIVTFVLVV